MKLPATSKVGRVPSFSFKTQFTFIDCDTSSGVTVGMKDGIVVDMDVTVIGNRPICKFTVLGFKGAVFTDFRRINPTDSRSYTTVRTESELTVIDVEEPPSAASFRSLLASSANEASE